MNHRLVLSAALSMLLFVSNSRPMRAADPTRIRGTLEAATGIKGEDALKAKATVEARFESEVELYLTKRKLFRGFESARQLADTVYDGNRFHYNVMLKVLKAYHDRPETRSAIEPVVERLCWRWNRTKWQRRIIAGGVVLGACWVTAAALYIGGQPVLIESIYHNPKIVGLWLLSFSALFDTGAAALTWYLMKANPETVFRENVATKVLETIEGGDRVTVEEGTDTAKEERLPGMEGIHRQD